MSTLTNPDPGPRTAITSDLVSAPPPVVPHRASTADSPRKQVADGLGTEDQGFGQEEEEGQFIHVAVLVAMPSLIKVLNSASPEYQFGTISIPVPKTWASHA
jgi:hypothetical protein